MRLSSFFAILLLAVLSAAGGSHAHGATAVDTNSTALPAEHAPGQAWTLVLPEEDNVVFRGVLNYDASGPSGNGMLYPAPNAGGFLAGLLTHAILLESMKHKRKTAAQEAADKVLLPFGDILKTYTYRELMQRALDKRVVAEPIKLIPVAEKNPGERVIQSMPVFSVTQDQTALVLDNVISISQPGAPSYVNTVRIVSAANEGPEGVQFWTANHGEKLKAVSAGMVADSLQIALQAAAGGYSADNTAFKTVRYPEGKTEKMERAILLREQCDRALIKTLRGWLMSVPVVRNPPAHPHCAEVSANLR